MSKKENFQKFREIEKTIQNSSFSNSIKQTEIIEEQKKFIKDYCIPFLKEELEIVKLKAQEKNVSKEKRTNNSNNILGFLTHVQNELSNNNTKELSEIIDITAKHFRLE